jgi:teichuronic acid biosynthesis glycosyltransferase TuaH
MDANAPWVRSLFQVMPAGVAVRAFRTRGPVAAVRGAAEFLRSRRRRLDRPRWSERPILIPSWSKLPRITTAVCRHELGRAVRGATNPVIVYTLPHYAGLVDEWPHVPRVYFAYDPYGCYTGWDAAAVDADERRMLAGCDAAFAVSPALAEDFRKLGDRPVFVQPNGVAPEFVAAFDAPLPAPQDLPPGGPPIVGCVGQISRAYDWDLLEDLVDRCPDLSFVFVGPLFPEGPEVRKQVDRLFARSNVRALGAKPHAELPRYIARFDVCLNPLRVDACNDRRSVLRFYDYLASDRPVVSTAIASALQHGPHVKIGRDAGEIAGLLHTLSGPGRPAIDRSTRREYLGRHTWERRAETFLSNLRTVLAARPA